MPKQNELKELIKCYAALCATLCTGVLLYIFLKAYPTGKILIDINQFGESAIELSFVLLAFIGCLWLLSGQLITVKDIFKRLIVRN